MDVITPQDANKAQLAEADIKGCTLLLVIRADFRAAALANEAFTRLLNQHGGGHW